jgi:hypothetical protein
LLFNRTYANIGLMFRRQKHSKNSAPKIGAETAGNNELTDDQIVEYSADGIVSLAHQVAASQRAETLVMPNTFHLPSYPIHADLLAEERLAELDRNLAVYRKVIQAVSESAYYTKRGIRPKEPIVRELESEDGHLVREIFTKLSHENVGYLIEKIHYDDTGEDPSDYEVAIKVPASDVEINDLGLDKSERPRYYENQSWGGR